MFVNFRWFVVPSNLAGSGTVPGERGGAATGRGLADAARGRLWSGQGKRTAGWQMTERILAGKTAVVTGSNSGIGLGVAEALAAAGAETDADLGAGARFLAGHRARQAQLRQRRRGWWSAVPRRWWHRYRIWR